MAGHKFRRLDTEKERTFAAAGDDMHQCAFNMVWLLKTGPLPFATFKALEKLEQAAINWAQVSWEDSDDTIED